MTDFHKTQQ